AAMPPSSQAATRIGSSRAASDTTCPRKHRKLSPTPSSRWPGIDANDLARTPHASSEAIERGPTQPPKAVPMKSVRISMLSLATPALVVSALASSALAAPATPVKNIVLVHGAFADGSSWGKVIPILQAKGLNVTAVQMPLTGFADDVAATQ